MKRHIKKNWSGSEFEPWSFKWLKTRVGRHIIEIARLAFPTVLSRLGGFFMAIVDTIMVTRYSAEQAQWLVQGQAPADIGFAIAVGFTIAIPILVSRAVGAKKFPLVGTIFRQGIIISIVVGAIATISSIIFGKSLLGIGNSQTIDEAYQVLKVYSFSLISAMIWMSCAGLFEALGKPAISFSFIILANIVNIILNWALIYGELGFKEYGAIGSAYTTLSVRIAVAILFFIFTIWYFKGSIYELIGTSIGKILLWKEAIILDITAAISIAAETIGFATLQLYSTNDKMALFEESAVVAANAWIVIMKILGIVFMVAIGFSTACNIRVGIARGRRNYDDLLLAIFVGTAVTTITLFFAGLIATLNAETFLSFFIERGENYEAILVTGTSIFTFILWIFIPDGMQAVLSGVLRTVGITWQVSVISIAIYAFVIPALGYYLAFILGYGIAGLFGTILTAMWTAFFIYASLFFIFRRKIKYLTLTEKIDK